MTFAISAIILFGIIIFVHELGHFLFAKVLGVRVLKFSLGFGPKIIGKTIGYTEYRISSFPLGGYVKMLGEQADDELSEEDKPFAYNYQPVWKRVIIVASGPIFNLAFAVLLFIVIFFAGVPVPYPDIGNVHGNSPAAQAGLMTGDRVLAIDGHAIQSWDEIDESLQKSSGKPILFKVQRGTEVIELSVIPITKTGKNLFGEDETYWDIGASSLLYPVVGEVVKGGRAEEAGMRKGDRIVTVDDTPIETWQDMTAIIHSNPEKLLHFTIERDDRIINMSITPEKKTLSFPPTGDQELGIIGIKHEGNDFIKKYNFSDAVSLGVEKTVEVSVLTLVVIVKLIQRVIPIEVIGGPIFILQMAGEQASRGLLDFFFFMAVININLGILNLLPIPILDGGHIVFLCIEAIRRKPLSEKIIGISQRVGIAVIITIMVFAFYNDIMRIITGKQFPW
jgi:regulator of sigma E protease